MSSYEYDEACIQAFLEQQLKLFPEEVAETPEEAEAFLEDCMAMSVTTRTRSSNTWKMRWIS